MFRRRAFSRQHTDFSETLLFLRGIAMPELFDTPARVTEISGLNGAPKTHLNSSAKSVQSAPAVNFGGILQNSAEVADAQLAIWKLQLTLGMLKLVAGAVGGLLILALGIYGFTLLDHAADVTLLRHPEGVWLSPVVRGGLYFLLALAVLGPIFKNAFSSSEGTKHA